MMMMTGSPKDNNPTLDDLISLSEAAKRTGLSISHLRLLVTKGDIWGKKLGRNWLTTEHAVQDYVSRGIKPGPKTRGK